MTIVALLVLTGLSETIGRVLPVFARRPHLSKGMAGGLVVLGIMIEGSVIALWPLAAWTVADLVRPALSGTAGLAWTPTLLAPLLLAAVLAFPLIGPLLHFLLVAGVAVTLVGPLAAASGLGWWVAAGCVAGAGLGLGVVVDGVRRLIGRALAGQRRPPVSRELIA